MAAIINALFGTYPEPEQQPNPALTQTAVQGQSATTSEHLTTTATADDVQVKSVISSETQANASINTKLNIDNLLSQLSTTHAQVDQYSRARTAEINEQVQRSIADVLANTQHQQEDLLLDANRRHLIIDNEYKLQLQKAVEALDAVKAKTLADLERDLQAKQQIILVEAKRQIDALNDQANAAKLQALLDAQEQAKQGIANIADQVSVIGQQETQNLLQSTTTTIITSQAQAASNVETVVAVADNQNQVALRGSTEVALASPVVGEQTTAFGTVTGASELTTTPATVATVETGAAHIETEVKAPQDNTTF